MATHVFDADLSLRGDAGRYELTVDSTWQGQPGIVYGGFLLAIVLRAAGLDSSASRPVSLACQFLRPAVIDVPLEIAVTSMRRGRTTDLLSVSITQAGKAVAEAHVRAAEPGSGPAFEPRARPGLVDPLSMRLAQDLPLALGVEAANFSDHIESRAPDFTRADLRDDNYCTWFRWGEGIVYDDPFLEAARYAMALDLTAPAVLHRLGFTWDPQQRQLPWGFTNLDLLAHFHNAPGTEWIWAEASAVVGLDGFGNAEAQIWSTDGQLLATGASQVAFFPIAR